MAYLQALHDGSSDGTGASAGPQGGVAGALLAALTELAPQEAAAGGVPLSGASKAVLRCLGASGLRDGSQQDAGEALEALCNALADQAAAWFGATALPALRSGAGCVLGDEADHNGTARLLGEWRRCAGWPMKAGDLQQSVAQSLPTTASHSRRIRWCLQ